MKALLPPPVVSAHVTRPTNRVSGNQPTHDYAYGESRPELRPVITTNWCCSRARCSKSC